MFFENIVKNFLNEVDDTRVYDEIFEDYLNQIDCDGKKCGKCYQNKKALQFLMRMHQRRKRIQKINEEFWAGVFHDIKSPMISIDYALKELVENDEILADIHILNRTNLNFIQELLESYRFESGAYEYKSEIVDLKKIIAELFLEHKYFLTEKNLKISLDKVEDGLCVEYDKTGISRIFSNLISNAIKFAHPESEIVIEGKKVEIENEMQIGQGILISISNSGKKIEQGMEKAIFEKFKTEDAKNGGASNGLGLYICKKIIKDANGKIWAENFDDGVKFNVVFAE